ncbi:MAG: sigma-54-dependent Fis family transcriptional regulator [Phycisphaerales bacterium]|nr:sigma-54-dependent Fis family transcriptional regulator [Phycisphaerales bacterium]
MSRVLVVDDKEFMRDSVGTTLQRAGMTVSVAADADAALALLAKRHPDAVITDLKMPGTDGLGLLQEIRKVDETIPVVLMTAYGTVGTAVSAMKLGAFDYITKPFEGDELVITMKRAIRHAGLVRENAVLRTRIADSDRTQGRRGETRGLDRLVGTSDAIARLCEEIRAVAQSHGTVLVCGETGTGKEVVARAIHEISLRKKHHYLAVNCAALSANLLESELFGHERGAFTGADQLRKGRFELADNGTLLLDEVSEIPLSLQAKLLRVLQESSFERVGSSVTQSVNVRAIATTNRELLACVRDGGFRQDLYFRLNVLPITVPPLRDHLTDIPALATHFLDLVAARDGTKPKEMHPASLALLQSYPWPGNVRELQNICERAHVLSDGPVIGPNLIEPWLRHAASIHAGNAPTAVPISRFVEQTVAHTTDGDEAIESIIPEIHIPIGSLRRLEEVEREAIVAALHGFNGHRQKTAEALGIGVRTLGLKLKKWKQLQLVAQDL